ncbi:hypothetical protein C7212DRAFT_175495 [Tuber magnatum]|uniref:Uncharacterized protein n=1 Tax=Tuber magnatum TaxID=42249 RepID=A0A317SU85_9PEZI|nr:hypothetical protein C7212DRAFT_175495 [Tuber magnatum]
MQESEHQGPENPSRGNPLPLSGLVPSQKPLLLMLFLLFLVSSAIPIAAWETFGDCGIRLNELAKNNSLPAEDIYTGPVKGSLGQAQNTEHPILLLTYAACEEHCGHTASVQSWIRTSDTIATWALPLVSLVLQAPFESNNFRQTMFLVFRWVGSPMVSMMYIFWNMKVTRKCAIMVEMSLGKDEHPQAPSNFSGLRDSFYLLSVINQYELNICTQLQEQGRETILRVGLFDMRPEFQRMRGRVAASIRRERRRGTVQALVSLGWFLVALGISINKAFVDLGEDSSAHSLGLGLLVCWLPVLVAATIVDRNPMDAHYVRAKLNKCLGEIVAIAQTPEVLFLEVTEPTFLGEFAGQGRVRWHRGAAHSILCTLEAMPGMGRGWLAKYENTDKLVTTGTSSPLLKCEDSYGWQMIASFMVVCSCTTGALFIGYPTAGVGMGCLSGGYIIFDLNAFGCLLIEVAAWVFLQPGKAWRVAQWVLRFCESTNFCWLVYIITAQTLRIYNNCYCRAGMRGGGRLYVYFEDVEHYKAYRVKLNWLLGTLITCGVSGIGLLYVVEQWCTQSFLWTRDWDSAMNGLHRVRKWKQITAGPRRACALAAGCMVKAGGWFRTVLRRERGAEDRSLRWS